MIESRKYPFIDIVKFVLAVSIISAHFASEIASFPQLIDNAFSIYIVAVPFFYMSSGFFFFRKMTSDKKSNFILLKKYIVRLLKIYFVWSLIYFVFVLASWFKSDFDLDIVLNYVHTALVFTTYPTIWFLPSLIVAVIFIYILRQFFSSRNILIITIILYIIGALGYSYSFILDDFPLLHEIFNFYILIFKTTRNGIFNGAIFIALALKLSENQSNNSQKKLVIFSALSLTFVIVEAFVLKIYFNNTSGADTIIFLIPFTYFFFQLCKNVKLTDNKIFKTLRDISLLMYLSQRIFLTAIPSIYIDFNYIYILLGDYLGLLFMVGLILVFSYTIIKASNKFKFLKILY